MRILRDRLPATAAIIPSGPDPRGQSPDNFTVSVRHVEILEDLFQYIQARQKQPMADFGRGYVLLILPFFAPRQILIPPVSRPLAAIR